ncbi:monosaccharide-sensing protein 2-like [Lolium rigidum]|uniref:monosaccharide-sensing protein 2-like n=1 Tax=Lolium rigidum TaxID=89674 RepID=UPI001F5CE14F|nr:monosaccharide-sensing protein 2-like [Lolium rigidum]
MRAVGGVPAGSGVIGAGDRGVVGLMEQSGHHRRRAVDLTTGCGPWPGTKGGRRAGAGVVMALAKLGDMELDGLYEETVWSPSAPKVADIDDHNRDRLRKGAYGAVLIDEQPTSSSVFHMEDLAAPLTGGLAGAPSANTTPPRHGTSRSNLSACKRVWRTMLPDFAPIDGAVLFGLVASIGNLLQGWDNASIAGSMLYIKDEFNLQSMPMVEGAIMAMALFGATMITTISGTLADAFGRRMMLLVSAVLSFITAMMVIFWSQQVYMLLLTRLIMGFSIGLAVTLVPIYISEIAPSEIRGKLNTFPQLSGSLGMLLSYCMVFWMSLMPKVDWRIMLGIQSIPSMIYSALIIFYLPESPSWLVRQGRVDEAKKVLQRLRRRQDVSGMTKITLKFQFHFSLLSLLYC